MNQAPEFLIVIPIGFQTVVIDEKTKRFLSAIFSIMAIIYYITINAKSKVFLKLQG